MTKRVTNKQAKYASTLADGPMKEYAPRLSLSEKMLPAIKDWNIGKKYTIELEVEMVSQRKGEEYDSAPGKVNGEFKVLSASDKEE